MSHHLHRWRLSNAASRLSCSWDRTFKPDIGWCSTSLFWLCYVPSKSTLIYVTLIIFVIIIIICLHKFCGQTSAEIRRWPIEHLWPSHHSTVNRHETLDIRASTGRTGCFPTAINVDNHLLVAFWISCLVTFSDTSIFEISHLVTIGQLSNHGNIAAMFLPVEKLPVCLGNLEPHACSADATYPLGRGVFNVTPSFHYNKKFISNFFVSSYVLNILKK